MVFKCYSDIYGNVVLKLGNISSKEIITEYNTLFEYAGRKFCKVYAADIENRVILEEYIRPGNPLNEENSLEKRLSVFTSLYKDLHIKSAKEERYPTYLQWVKRITQYMSKREDYKDLYLYMKKAEEICLNLSSLYPRRMLLHGDFHHENILLANDGEYRIIDPKGVIGDPVFDIPRFILNEFDNVQSLQTYKKIQKVIRILGEILDIPEPILKQCFFVETAMGACWCVEDDEYEDHLKDVIFAEEIMNGGSFSNL
ncbi:aminoglycoside phosphotransferase family protein [Natronospora cellulosivora (SeqCode)]